MKIKDKLHGFTVIGKKALPAIDAVAYWLQHDETGARYLHVEKNDPENVFSIAFPTLASDSTGVAHILEHCVLAGSHRYRGAKDPFFSMVGGRSLAGFLNAFTAMHWTMYPFATASTKDFRNLLEVYLDAVFHPNLSPLTFMQEGWRYTVDDKDQVHYSGVVFNEMSGAMTSPARVLEHAVLRNIYPNTPYAHNAGGDPLKIPNLTYEQFRAFHRDHYCSSNAFIFTSGPQPITEFLELINDQLLCSFRERPVKRRIVIPSQPRWSAPRTVEALYQPLSAADIERGYQVCLAWLTADNTQVVEVAVLTLLEEILLGSRGAPLKQALLDSGLGQALGDAQGLDLLKDVLFTTGLKGVRKEDAPKVEAVIMNTLHRLVKDGIDPALVEAALHQFEFAVRDIAGSSYYGFPCGLLLLVDRVIDSWVCGGDPLIAVDTAALLRGVKSKLHQPHFLEDCLQKYFLDNNPHRLTLTLVPDPKLDVRQKKEFADMLSKAPGRGLIHIDTIALEQYHQQKDRPECLPTLIKEDVPHGVVKPPRQPYSAQYVHHPIPAAATSSITDLQIVLGAGNILEELLAWVSFYTFTLTKTGTATHTYDQMAEKIRRWTRGVGAGEMVVRHFKTKKPLPLLTLTTKAFDEDVVKMFDVVQEIMEHVDFTSDPAHIRQLFLEYRKSFRDSIVWQGTAYAGLLAARNLTSVSKLEELWQGIHQLHFVESIDADNAEYIADHLQSVHTFVMQRHNMRFMTAGDVSQPSHVKKLNQIFPTGQNGFAMPPLPLDNQAPNEGWAIASPEAYVAQCLPAVTLGHPDAPALCVLSRLLTSVYLFPRIRKQGGAYGTRASADLSSGTLSLTSYRDPVPTNTLQVFAEISDFIKTGKITDGDIERAIIKTCADMFTEKQSAWEAAVAFHRWIIGVPDKTRAKLKQDILEVNKFDIRALAKYFDAARTSVVISNEKLLKEMDLEIHRI